MIKFEHTEVSGWEAAVRGLRNPLNSWAKSDSGRFYEVGEERETMMRTFDELNEFCVGDNDHDLMMRLAKAGTEHAKYRRMINVTVDITAPLYWWKEFDTYKVGTVANSCSTMHKLAAKEFALDDFSHEKIIGRNYFDVDKSLCVSFLDTLRAIIEQLNSARALYIETNDKNYWWQMVQLLPSSYNQKRTVQLNYEVLAAMYRQRRNHKLDEWHDFCEWVETLPYAEIITAGCDA